jgi:type II secretory pathway predicted ATPase ExeA
LAGCGDERIDPCVSLYLNHFELTAPFKSPRPDFSSPGACGDVLSALEHVAGTEEGIIIVVAEVGSGKTLLARLLLERLGSEIARSTCPTRCFRATKLLPLRVTWALRMPKQHRIEAVGLQSELLRRHAGQQVLAVVDEAHAMPPESLEETVCCPTLDGSSQAPQYPFVWATRLDALLARNELRQVATG